MRAAVERLDCADIAPPLRPTISLGVAEWSAGEPFERVAGRADERLYLAKQSGRNRVVAG
jgi:PleD family two-component response regulator